MRNALFATVFACLFASQSAQAADKFFDNSSSNELFRIAENWSDDAFPDGRTVIAGGLTSRVEVADSFAGFGDLYVGGNTDGPVGSGVLIVDGQITVDGGAGNTIVGSNQQEGTLTLSDGASLTVTNILRVGRNGGGGGTVNIADAMVNIGHDLVVSGGGGTSNFSLGTVNQTAGMLDITNAGSNLNIAQANSATGTYNLSGGTVNITQHLNFGNLGTGMGFLNVSGTGEFNAGNQLHFRRGVVTIDGGSVHSGQVNAAGDVNIGIDEASDALVVVNGGLLASNDQLLIGRAGTNSMGQLLVTGGAVSADNHVNVRSGSMIISNGLVTAGAAVNNADVIIGHIIGGVTADVELHGGELRVADSVAARNGHLNQSGGTLTVGTATNIADLIVGGEAGGFGRYTLSDGAAKLPDNLNIGLANLTATGEVLVAGGTMDVGRILNVLSGTMVQSNGTIRVSTAPANSGGLAIATASGSFGTYQMSGGLLDSKTYINIGGNTGNSEGFLELHGGTLVASNAVAVRKGTVIQTGGEIVSTANMTIGSNSNQDGTYLISGGKITAMAQLHMGQTASNGVGRLMIDGGAIETVSHVQARRGAIDMSRGTLNVGGNLNVATEDGSETVFTHTGGDLVVSNALTVGRNAGGGLATFIVQGGSGSIQSGASFNLRTNAFLTTIIGSDGIVPIETLNDGSDVSFNGGSTWDVVLAGGVNFSDSSSNLVFIAKDRINQNANLIYDEVLFDRVLAGANGDAAPRLLYLTLAGAGLGSIEAAGGNTLFAPTNGGWIAVNNLGGQLVELQLEVSVGGGTDIPLVQHLIAAGYAARVVSPGLVGVAVSPTDSDSFFAFDFSDFDAVNGGVTMVSGVSAISMSEGIRVSIERVSSDTRRISFISVLGTGYRLQIRPSATSGAWADEGGIVLGTGGEVDIEHISSLPYLLYRVREDSMVVGP